MNLELLLASTYEQSFCKLCEKLKNENKLQKFFVVVPDHATLLCEQRLVEEMGVGGLFSIDIITLNTLAKMVLEEKANRTISQTGLLAVVKKIILEEKENFQVFKKVCMLDGFAGVLYATILQLKTSLIGVADLQNSLSDMPLHLAAKMQDVLLVYRKHEAFLKGEIFDGPSKFSETIKQIKFCDEIKDSKFAFAYFETITNQISQILLELTKHSKEVLFCSINGKQQNNAIIYPTMVTDTIKKITSDFNINLIANIDGIDEQSLENNLFSFTNNQIKNNNKIALKEFENCEQEIEEIAQQIFENVREQKDKFESFSLAVSNLEVYKKTIFEVFNKYEIPYNIDEKIDSMNSVVSKAILNLLDVFNSNFNEICVKKLLNCTIFDINFVDFCQFENFTTKNAISNGEFFHNFFGDDNAENVRKKLIEATGKSYDIFKQSKTISGYIEAIILFMKTCNFDEKFGTEIDEPKSKENKIVYEKICIFLNELDLVLGESEVNYADFKNILETCILNLKVSLAPVLKNAVFVGDAFESFFAKTKKMFIVGADESRFPIKQKDVGVVLDDEINLLKTSFDLTPKIVDINKKNFFRTFELCFLGNEVQLSFSKILEQNSNRPSLTMLNLAACLGLKIEKSKAKQNVFTLKQSTLLAYRNLNEINFGNIYLDDEFLASLCEVISIGKDDFAFENNLFLKNKDVFFKNKRTSSSELTTYSTCPFKHFLNYVLKLKKQETASIENLDIGNIVHKFCEKYVYFKAEGKVVEPKKLMKEICLNEKFKDTFENKKNNIISRELLDEATNIAKKLDFHLNSTSFVPKMFEKTFETELTNELNLKGKIDRIDEYENYLRVIDYKTGNKKFSFSDIYFGLDLQLTTYGFITKALNKTFAGAFYMPIQNTFSGKNFDAKLTGFMIDDLLIAKIFDKNLSVGNKSEVVANLGLKTDGTFYKSGILMTEKEMTNILNYGNNMAKLLVDQIKQGVVEPNVALSSFNPCDYCDFSSLTLCKSPKCRKLCGKISKENFNGETYGV